MYLHAQALSRGATKKDRGCGVYSRTLCRMQIPNWLKRVWAVLDNAQTVEGVLAWLGWRQLLAGLIVGVLAKLQQLPWAYVAVLGLVAYCLAGLGRLLWVRSKHGHPVQPRSSTEAQPPGDGLEAVRRLLREAATTSRSMHLPEKPSLEEAGHQAWFVQKTISDFLDGAFMVSPASEYRAFLESEKVKQRTGFVFTRAAAVYLERLAVNVKKVDLDDRFSLPRTFAEFAAQAAGTNADTLQQSQAPPTMSSRPRVAPLKYGKDEDGSEGLFLETHGEPAYNVRIAPVMIGRWTLSFRGVHQITRQGGAAFCGARLTCGNNLVTKLLRVWQDQPTEPSQATILVTYDDGAGSAYRSVCRMEIDVLEPEGIAVSLERQERIEHE
jgi:hypothetical protein